MEVPKSEISKKADAARAKATGLKAAREKAANAIAGDLDAARAEVSRHDALPELSAPQHLALENARKRVKHLTSQLAEAGAAIAAAQEAAADVAHTNAVATLTAVIIANPDTYATLGAYGAAVEQVRAAAADYEFYHWRGRRLAWLRQDVLDRLAELLPPAPPLPRIDI